MTPRATCGVMFTHDFYHLSLVKSQKCEDLMSMTTFTFFSDCFVILLMVCIDDNWSHMQLKRITDWAMMMASTKTPCGIDGDFAQIFFTTQPMQDFLCTFSLVSCILKLLTLQLRSNRLAKTIKK